VRAEGEREAQFPETPNRCGVQNGPNKVASTFFSMVNLPPKELRFEHGDTKLVSCPGGHLTSVSPWLLQQQI